MLNSKQKVLQGWTCDGGGGGGMLVWPENQTSGGGIVLGTPWQEAYHALHVNDDMTINYYSYGYYF